MNDERGYAIGICADILPYPARSFKEMSNDVMHIFLGNTNKIEYFVAFFVGPYIT